MLGEDECDGIYLVLVYRGDDDDFSWWEWRRMYCVGKGKNYSI